MEDLLDEMQRQAYQERVAAHRERYRELKDQLTALEVGEHEIEVAEVLFVGVYMYAGANTVIVRDTEGRLIEIPEAALRGRVVSRHDVRRGMRFMINIVLVPVIGLTAFVGRCEKI